MVNESNHQLLLLIYGDPNQGKTTLGNQLEDYRYHVVRLDSVYVDFVITKYPEFEVPHLDKVIAQHYNYILAYLDGRGKDAHGAKIAWLYRVIDDIDNAFTQNDFVAVEGYLLSPILQEVQERYADKATVRTILVHNHQYFIARTVEEINEELKL